MVQNRNKLIELFIGNISNSIIHQSLEKAVSKKLIADKYADKYRKELTTSFEIAKRYRERINPVNRPLPEKDIAHIRIKIINKVKTELMTRISKGYKNIDLILIGKLVDKALKDADVE